MKIRVADTPFELHRGNLFYMFKDKSYESESECRKLLQQYGPVTFLGKVKGPTRGGTYTSYYTYEMGETEGAAAIAALNGKLSPPLIEAKLELVRLD